MLLTFGSGLDVIFMIRAFNSMKNDFKLYTENLSEAKARGYLPAPMPKQLDTTQEAINYIPYYKGLFVSFASGLEALGEPVPQSAYSSIE